jgi:hypothetical protein
MSLFYTKIAILCLVLTLQYIGVNWGNAPYFPIEISRTAQSSHINLWLFPLGVSLLPCIMIIAGEWNTKYIPSLAGLAILAIFDDKSNLILHQIGVLTMVLGSGYIIAHSDSLWNRFMLLCSSIILYIVRVIMKAFIVAMIEIDLFSLQSILTKSIEIMYNGAAACKHPQYTLPIFQVGGLLQWVVFYLIICAIE